MSRILVIDDEPELLRFVQRALEAANHEVMVASDGVRGLGLALQWSPDLTVLDLLMPETDGRCVLTSILAMRPSARVMVLSAIADVGARADCLELGAVDFLAKPFMLREFLARVRSRVGEAPPEHHPEVIEAGGIELDLRTRTVRAAGHETALTQREFLLMLHLMRRADQVCSRAELWSEVWGYGFDPSTNVVDVYVARLRNKLRSDAIRTVRNVGYQLQTG